MERGLVRVALFATVLAGPLIPRAADACGGFVYQEPDRAGGMAGQQIFVAFGADATALVVAPTTVDVTGDMAFILPLAAPPDDVMDGDAYLFATLDHGTAPTFWIQDPEMDGEPEGCGSDPRGDKGGGAVGGGDGGGHVDLYDQGSTGTYDYVVVGGSTGTSVADWLDQEGFQVDPATQTALDPYVEQGWVFLAAKLSTNADRLTLAPLQLHLPPMAPEVFSIPFAFGAPSLPEAEQMDLTLYLVADRPMVPKNYERVELDIEDVTAMSRTRTDYPDLFEDAVSTEGGAIVVEHLERGFEPQVTLTSWVEQGFWENPNLPSPDAIPSPWLNGFEIEGALTRVRTRLGADDLRDMTFEADRDLIVSLRGDVIYTDDSGCSVPGRGLGPAALLGLLVLLRRRRA